MTDKDIKAAIEAANLTRKLKDALIHQAIVLRDPGARFSVVSIARRQVSWRTLRGLENLR